MRQPPTSLHPSRLREPRILPLWTRAAALLLLCTGARLAAQTPATPAEHPGAEIYRKMCVDCHGKHGEGVKGKHDKPLAGTRSIAGLARLIARTMPEDKEGTCVGPDADAVAAYIHEAFYSPTAQARIRPVQESFSHLTTTQFRNSVADLVGHFRPGFHSPLKQERGLQVFYSGFVTLTPEELEEKKAAEKDPNKRKELEKRPLKAHKFDRIEPTISVHFGADSPDPATMIPSEFQVRWQGALLAPETGLYEFILKSENGVRLFVNSTRDPIVDAWVSTGPAVREERRSLFLLGGRPYRLQVEMLKFKDKSASVELWWKPPHGVLELLPQRNLIPQDARPTLALSTNLPADDRSDGYERGTALSKEWDQATTAAALDAADHVEAEVDSLAGTKAAAPDRIEKLKAFSARFLEAAFRTRLNEEQRATWVDRYFDTAPTPSIAVRRVVLFAIKSPRFLYPEILRDETTSDFLIAARLALVLWDSLPDPLLARSATEGRLRTRAQLEKEVQRMLADPRARAKLDGFFDGWLDLERAEHAAKDATLFPEFDEAVRADLRHSLRLFLGEVAWGDAPDYRRLLNADHLWLNDRLAKLYGASVAGPDFERVVPSSGTRSGVLTHPYLLSSLAYNRTTSPIHRGVFLSRSIVGIQLKNPSTAVAFEDAKFDPSLTMRQKVSELTKSASCAGCHGVINPLGFTLEHFDPLGRFRSEDNQRPVDSTVDFDTEDGERLHLTGPADVARHATASPHAHEAFVRQLFHHHVKQPPGAFGPDTLARLTTQFADNGFHLRKLLTEIAVTKALHGMPQPQ